MQQDLNDYILCQAAYGLNSRSEVNLEYNPIISAPMDTVIAKVNAHLFRNAGVNICYPRGLEVEPNEVDFVSVGLKEFRFWLDGEKDLNNTKICIDVANGNMPILHSYIKEAKEKWPNIVIMSGNIASPSAFRALAATGCDYIRVGIGGGSGCLTSVHTGVGQGMGSLLLECRKRKYIMNLKTQIVADGGFKNYRDIIMALALGADYVMLGGILNKCVETASQKTLSNGTGINFKFYNISEFESNIAQIETDINNQRINYKYNTEESKEFYRENPLLVQSDINYYIKNKYITTNYRGMSTKAVQLDWGREKLQSSEGIEKINVVEYTISGWMENFLDYLKSAMSYSGATTLEQFIKEADTEEISPAVYNRFNK